MSKANQKARFSIVNLFDNDYFRLNNMDRALKYLDYDEIIDKTPTVKQALKEIKLRKDVEKHFLNLYNPKISKWMHESKNDQKVLKHRDHHQIVSDQIQRGFDIAHSWNFEEPWWWFTE